MKFIVKRNFKYKLIEFISQRVFSQSEVKLNDDEIESLLKAGFIEIVKEKKKSTKKEVEKELKEEPKQDKFFPSSENKDDISAERSEVSIEQSDIRTERSDIITEQSNLKEQLKEELIDKVDNIDDIDQILGEPDGELGESDDIIEENVPVIGWSIEKEEVVEENIPDYRSMLKRELVEIAKEKNIANPDYLKKVELITLLENSHKVQ